MPVLLAALAAGWTLVPALAPAAGAGLVPSFLLLILCASIRFLLSFLTSAWSLCPITFRKRFVNSRPLYVLGIFLSCFMLYSSSAVLINRTVLYIVISAL